MADLKFDLYFMNFFLLINYYKKVILMIIFLINIYCMLTRNKVSHENEKLLDFINIIITIFNPF